MILCSFARLGRACERVLTSTIYWAIVMPVSETAACGTGPTTTLHHVCRSAAKAANGPHTLNTEARRPQPNGFRNSVRVSLAPKDAWTKGFGYSPQRAAGTQGPPLLLFFRNAFGIHTTQAPGFDAGRHNVDRGRSPLGLASVVFLRLRLRAPRTRRRTE